MTARRSQPSNRRPLLAWGVGAFSVGATSLLVSALTLGPRRAAAATPLADSDTVPPALSALLKKFRSCPGLFADYEEEKHIVLLAAPLKSQGRVYFNPPGSLARIVNSRHPSHLVVSGQRIVVKEDGVRREVDLSDKPALRGLVSSLLNVLAGDEPRLLRDYEMHFTTDAPTWRLELVPKSSEVKRMVTSLTFVGEDLKLSELTVKEESGDSTITRFSNVNTKRKFSAAEIARIFQI